MSDSIYLVQRIARNRYPRDTAVGVDRVATFEYMGSTEFEVGLSLALKRLRAAPIEKATGPFTLDGTTRSLHLLSHPANADSAWKKLDAWAAGADFRRPFRAKDYTAFPEVFGGDTDRETIAWWSFDIDAIWTLDEVFADEFLDAVNTVPAK